MATNNLEYQLRLKLEGIDTTLKGLDSKLVESGKKIGAETGDGIVKTLNERLKVLEASSQKAKLALETISQAKVKIGVDTDLVNIKIKEVEARLATLRLKDSSPKIDIQIEKEVNKIANLQSQLGKLKVSEIRLDIKEENSAKIFSNLELRTNNLKGRISSVLAEEQSKVAQIGNKIGNSFGDGVANGITSQSGKIKGSFQSIVEIAAGNALANAFGSSLQGVKDFVSGSLSQFNEYKKAITTLEIVSPKFGLSAEKAKSAANDLAKELKLGVGTTAESLQNLFKSGLNIDQASDLLKRFNNEAITGKSSSISLDDAVRNLSFAYNTQNSALGNMSGVSENFSDIQERGLKILQSRGELLGLSVGELDEAQKKEAQYAGIIDLTNLTLGSSAKFQGSFIDNQAKLDKELGDTQIAIGEKIDPAFNSLVLAATPAVTIVKDFVKSFKIESLEPFTPFLYGLAGAITIALTPALIAGGAALISFAIGAAPFLLIGALIAGAAYLIKENWATIGPFFEGIKNNIIRFVDEVGKVLNSVKFSFESGAIGDTSAVVEQFLSSVGLPKDIAGSIGTRVASISSNLKKAFDEIKQASTGNLKGASTGLAKVLGIDQAQATQITGVIATISQAIQNLPATLSGAFNTVKQFFTDTFNNPLVQAGIGTITTTFTTLLLPALLNLGNTISTLFLPVITQVINFLGIVLPPILTFLGAVIGAVLVGAINVAIVIFTSLINTINLVINVFTIIGSVALAIFGTIVAFISATVQSIIAIFTGNFGALEGIWSGFLGQLNTLWTNTWNTVIASIGNIWNLIVGGVKAGWAILSAYFSFALGWLKDRWSGAWNSISSTVSGVWTTIKTGVSDGINAVIDYFSNLGTQIIDIVSGINLGDIGRNLIQTMIDGIKSMAGAVAGAINGLLRNVSGGAFGLPGYASGVTNFGGGPAIVGEQGFEILKTPSGQSYIANSPQLLNLPRGTDVYTNAQSQKMLSGRTGNQGVQVLERTKTINNSPTYQNFGSNRSGGFSNLIQAY
jgi:phage-related protein